MISKIFMNLHYMFSDNRMCNVFLKDVYTVSYTITCYQVRIFTFILCSSFCCVISIFLTLSVTMLFTWKSYFSSTVWIISLHFFDKNSPVFFVTAVSSTSTIYDFPLTWTHKAVMGSLWRLFHMSMTSVSCHWGLAYIRVYSSQKKITS